MTTNFTALQLSDIRADLTSARAAVFSQVATIAESDALLVAARLSQEERAKSAGDADLMGVERDVLARMSQSITEGLAELDDALARIESGTYGACTGCGKPIHPERLAARPRAAKCVTCAARR